MHLQDDIKSAKLFVKHADPSIAECSGALGSKFQAIVCTCLQRHSKRPSSAEVCCNYYAYCGIYRMRLSGSLMVYHFVGSVYVGGLKK